MASATLATATVCNLDYSIGLLALALESGWVQDDHVSGQNINTLIINKTHIQGQSMKSPLGGIWRPVLHRCDMRLYTVTYHLYHAIEGQT